MATIADTPEMISICLKCPRPKCTNCMDSVSRDKAVLPLDPETYVYEPPKVSEAVMKKLGHNAEVVFDGYNTGMYDYEIAKKLQYSTARVFDIRKALGLKPLPIRVREVLRYRAGLV